jgi:hypothetical protein
VFAQQLADIVRPLLTLGFAAATIFLTCTGKIDPEFLKGIASATVAYWFAERATRWQASLPPAEGQAPHGG